MACGGTETLFSFEAAYENHDFPLSISTKLHLQPDPLYLTRSEDESEPTFTTEDGHNHDIISHNGVEIIPKLAANEHLSIGTKIFLSTTGEFRPRIYSVLEFHFDADEKHDH